MTIRVLLVRHLTADGEPLGEAEYCATCGQAITSETQRVCGSPRFTNRATGVTLYEQPDGELDAHEWVDRRAVVCCGAACVQQTARTA